MGFFDSIFGKKTGGSEVKGRMNARALVAELRREEEKRLAGAHSECGPLCGRIMESFGEIENVARELEKKNVDMDPAFAKIAGGMRTNFVPRARSATKIELKGEGYSDLLLFHEAAMRNLATLTKISSDNRYLFHFFKEEMGRLGDAVKRATKYADELKERLDARRKSAEPVESLRAEAEKFEGKLGELANLKSSIAKIQDEVREKTGRASKFVTDDSGFRKIDETRAQKAKARELISARLGALERPLRKFEKICADAFLRKLAGEYVSAPFETFAREEAEYPHLKSLLVALRACIEKGEIKLKNQEGIIEDCTRIIDGSLAAWAEEYKRLGKEEEALEKETEPAKRIMEEKKNLEDEVRALGDELKKSAARADALEKEIDEKKAELEKRFEKIVKRKIEIELEGES
ncbi:MAG: hypothetical protein AB1468_05645 [Candidatus Micrarchaeota archaeon]